MSQNDNKWGIAHVHASFNNTVVMTVTDLTGAETIAKSSGGTAVKQNRDEASPYAAMQMAESVAEEVKAAGITGLHVRVRGPGGNLQKSPVPARRRRSARSPARASRSGESRTSRRSPRRIARTERQGRLL